MDDAFGISYLPRNSFPSSLVFEHIFEYIGVMKPDLSAAAAASPLRGAMDGLDTALQHLIKVVEDGALGDLGAVSLVGFLQEFEQFCNQLPVVDRAAIQP